MTLEVTEITPTAPLEWRASCDSSSLPDLQECKGGGREAQKHRARSQGSLATTKSAYAVGSSLLLGQRDNELYLSHHGTRLAESPACIAPCS